MSFVFFFNVFGAFPVFVSWAVFPQSWRFVARDPVAPATCIEHAPTHPHMANDSNKEQRIAKIQESWWPVRQSSQSVSSLEKWGGEREGAAPMALGRSRCDRSSKTRARMLACVRWRLACHTITYTVVVMN